MLKLIAIVEKNFGISLNGTIPWEFPEDRLMFYELTKGSTVIMGRYTFFSSKNFPLKDRNNIVITKSKIPNVTCFSDVQEVLKTYPNAWIIGGAQLYNYVLKNNLIDLAVITHLHKAYKADRFINKDYLQNLKCIKTFNFKDFDIEISKKPPKRLFIKE